MSQEEVFTQRKNKFLKIGRNKGFIDNLDELSSLQTHKNQLVEILKSSKYKKMALLLISILIVSLAFFL